jgi:hypothetical protein
MGLWLAISPRIKLYALALLAFIATILKLRHDAVSKALLKLQVDQAEKRIDAMRTAKEIEDEIEILDDSGLSGRASRWVREGRSE